MQNFDELGRQLKFTPEQKSALESYISQLAIELLESIKQDNIDNFDETINSLKSA